MLNNGVLFFLLLLTVGLPAQDQPMDGWADRVYLSREERREIRKEKFAEMEAWEQEHFTAPNGKWYIGTRGGLTIPFLTIQNSSPEYYLGTSDLFISDDGTEILDRGIYSANAGGYRAAIYAGAMFNKYVGLELDVGFNYYKRVLLGRNNTPLYKSELVTWSRDISIMPQIVFNSPNFRNFYLYAKVGFFLPVWGGTSGEAFVDDRNGDFIRDLAGQPTSGILTAVDLIAELIGENVDGLGFLDEGIFVALGYHVHLDADVEITLRPDVDALGYTAALGARYQISPLVSLFGELRVAGYNISTDESKITKLNLTGDLLGRPDLIIITENGGSIDGESFGPEELTSLLVTDYVYELDEHSNSIYNPDGIDPTKPTQVLADRKSANGFTFSLGLQFNFKGKKQKGKE